MSKIQKALDRLRDVDHKEGKARLSQVAEVGNGEFEGEVRNGAGSGFVESTIRRRRMAESDNGEKESPAQNHIDVDRSRLLDLGLQVEGDQLENLAQEFRRIKRPILNIVFGEIGAGTPNSNVVMMTSALPKSGKTFCSYNLATSIAKERDIGAVLVDADVLKPNISRAFNVEDRVGLIDYLLHPEITLDNILIGTDLHDIVLVPAGQRHREATELLASRRMEQFTYELSLRFASRVIVVDTPPLLLTNEAQVLAEHMGQIVLVVEAGETSHQSLLDSLENLNREKPINAVINKARGSLKGSYRDGYGGGYYGYYSAPEAGRDKE